MLTDVLDEVLSSWFPLFLDRLASFLIIPGVSLLHFWIALFVLIAVIGAILMRV